MTTEDIKVVIGACTIIAIITAIILQKIIKATIKESNKKKTEYENKHDETNYLKNTENTKQNIKYSDYLPYCKKYLLTKNEWFFYKVLKEIADELGYTILAKVRVADLVEVTTKDYELKGTYLNKVASKHIDFVLARPENLKVEILIELDDNTHDSIEVKERDDFINKLYQKTGYKFIRVRGTGNLKEIIKEQLKEQETAPTEV